MPRGISSVRANRRGPNAVRRGGASAYGATFPPGSHTFTPPKAGYYLFTVWGPGGGSNNFTTNLASGAGAYSEYTRYLRPRESVALVVGIGNFTTSVASTATFADGHVVSAGPGITGIPTGVGGEGVGGAATGGDVNLAGSAGGTGSVAPEAGLGSGGGAPGAGLSGGAGAPGVLPFRGGAGAAPNVSGTSPGGGGGATGSGDQAKGGDGQIVVLLLGASRTRPA